MTSVSVYYCNELLLTATATNVGTVMEEEEEKKEDGWRHRQTTRTYIVPAAVFFSDISM